jgi:hypothetical protein
MIDFDARAGTVKDGGNGRFGLTEAMGLPTQANDACGAVGGGEDTLDLAPPTLGTAMCAFPKLAPCDSLIVRAGVHGS